MVKQDPATPDRARRRRGTWQAGIFLFFGVVFSVMLIDLWSGFEAHRNELRQLAAEKRAALHAALRLQSNRSLDQVNALARFYLATDSVTREEFLLFSQSRNGLSYARPAGSVTTGAGWAPAVSGNTANPPNYFDFVTGQASSEMPALSDQAAELVAAGSERSYASLIPGYLDRAREEAEPQSVITVMRPIEIGGDAPEQSGWIYTNIGIAHLIGEVQDRSGVEVTNLRLRNSESSTTFLDLVSQVPPPRTPANGSEVRTGEASQILGNGRFDISYRYTVPTLYEFFLRERLESIFVTGGVGLLIGAMLFFLLRQASLARRAARDAQAATAQKARFLATMSHEMRTPLNAILGMSDLVMSGPLTERQVMQMRTLDRSAESLLALISQILDLSKAEAEMIELDASEVRLDELLAEVFNAVNVIAAEKKLSLLMSVPAEVPRTVEVDALRLRQILLNLLSNAIKFTARGHVALRVDLSPHRIAAEGRAWVRFRVLDTGIGIENDRLEHVFGEFRQVDSSTTRLYGGTGLGLSISRHLARLMGGSLTVESRPGEGSVFTLEVELQALRRSGNLRRQRALAAAQKVLLLVDDDLSADMLEEALSSLGGMVSRVASEAVAREVLTGEQALTDPYDIIVIDAAHATPSVISALVAAGQDSGVIPKVALLRESWRSAGELTGARPAGVDFFLDQPFTVERLSQQISHALSRQVVSRPVAEPGEQRELSFPGARVLLVEDDAVNRMYAETLLSEMQCEVVEAVNGAESLERAAEAPFDLILMDCQMPVMDGFTAARELSARMESGALPRVPIVALTANAMKGDREACLAAGMQDYATKPIRRQAMQALLARWLQHRSSGAPAPDAGAAAQEAEPLLLLDPISEPQSPAAPPEATAPGDDPVAPRAPGPSLAQAPDAPRRPVREPGPLPPPPAQAPAADPAAGPAAAEDASRPG
uniref:ATP-binding protein n=1 Tax=Oceanicella sp. SM1341 TaxID=1548889 RepID=UPI000E50D3F5